nr:heparinase II/III family protein [bacterium]
MSGCVRRSLLAVTAALVSVAHAAQTNPVVSLEAEKATLCAKRAAVVSDREDASGAACVRLRTPGRGREDKPAEAPESSLRATLDIPWRGPVMVWARVLAPNGGTDSLWLGDGDREPRMVTLSQAPDWRWQRLHAMRLRQPGSLDLRITTREAGVLIDRIVVLGSPVLAPKGVSEIGIEEIESPYPEPPVTPPAEHPRVFLRREHVPMIKERLAHPFMAETRKRFYAEADRPGDGKLPTPKDAKRGNYSPSVLRTIDCNALLYVLDGDRARGQRAVDMFLNVKDTVVFPDRRDVTRQFGRAILSGGLVYDWCYDLLTDAQRPELLEAMVELASMTEMGYPPRRQGAVTGHGGEAQLMREQLAAAIAVYDEYPIWYRFGAGRFFAEFVPARNFFFKAHRHHQGDSYGWYRFRWSMFATYIFDRLGAGAVFSADQGQMPYSWIYMRRGDGSLLRDGDTFSNASYWMFPYAAMMTASYYRDPYINDEFRRQWRVRPHCVAPQWMVLFYDPTVEVKPVGELPLTRYFPCPAGDMIARTGWRQGLASPAGAVEMKGAFYHFNNHDHLDAGAFQIYYRGALATDAGCYGYYGIPYDWHWNKRSISHNTLLVYDPAAPQNPLKHDGGQNY